MNMLVLTTIHCRPCLLEQNHKCHLGGQPNHMETCGGHAYKGRFRTKADSAGLGGPFSSVISVPRHRRREHKPTPWQRMCANTAITFAQSLQLMNPLVWAKIKRQRPKRLAYFCSARCYEGKTFTSLWHAAQSFTLSHPKNAEMHLSVNL